MMVCLKCYTVVCLYMYSVAGIRLCVRCCSGKSWSTATVDDAQGVITIYIYLLHVFLFCLCSVCACVLYSIYVVLYVCVRR